MYVIIYVYGCNKKYTRPCTTVYQRHRWLSHIHSTRFLTISEASILLHLAACRNILVKSNITFSYIRLLNDKPLELVDKKHSVSVVKTVLETLHTLTVTNSTPADSGVYKAVVVSPAGEVMSETKITITRK